MTSVGLDHLTAVAVADRCNAPTQRDVVTGRPAGLSHFTHTHTLAFHMYLRRLCACTEADWWRLSRGSPAGTLASPPSRNAPSQLWEGRTAAQGGSKKKKWIFNVKPGDCGDAEPAGLGELGCCTSLEGLAGRVNMVCQ